MTISKRIWRGSAPTNDPREAHDDRLCDPAAAPALVAGGHRRPTLANPSRVLRRKQLRGPRTTVKQPETRYAKGPEGNIAYQLLGDGPMDLVVVPGGFSHLDMLWSEVHHHWNALRPPRTQRATNTVARSAVRRPGVGAVGAAATDLSATLAPWPRRLRPVLGLIGAGSVFGVVVVARLRTTILTSNALPLGSSACYALGLYAAAH
jgi:hypothetical protein